MEVVLAIALAAAIGLSVGRIGGPVFDSLTTAVSQLVGGYRSDAWPRGVQEEDRDQPWGRVTRFAAKAARSAQLSPMPKPPLTRVRPTVHTR